MCSLVFGSILIGFIFIGGGGYLVWWNEANRVCTSAAYDKAEANVVEGRRMLWPSSSRQQHPNYPVPVQQTRINRHLSQFVEGCDPTGKNGQFIHLACPVDENLQTVEESTGIVANDTYKLEMTSQQYSYQQYSTKQSCTKGTSGCNDDGEQTCTCYRLDWTSSPVTTIDRANLCRSCPEKVGTSSSIPPKPAGGTPTTGLGTFQVYAESVSLGNGAFIIGQDQIEMIQGKQRVPAPDEPFTTATGNFNISSSSYCSDDSLSSCWVSTEFRNKNSCSSSNGGGGPCLGDKRIIVKAYSSTFLSAIGRDSPEEGTPVVLIPKSFGGSKLPPCDSRSIFYISNGNKSAEMLFDELQTALETLTTILRVVSLFVIVLGVYLLFYPLEALIDMIPIVGDFLSSMVGWILILFSSLLGGSLWLLLFALAWVFYRPAVGISLLVVAILFLGITVYLQRRTKQEKELSE